MAIKCGNCSSFQNPVYHDTVADVRACYGQRTGVTSRAPETASHPAPSQPNYFSAKTTVPFPEGRYAILMPDGKLHFYKVDCPTDGRWAGYVFIKEQAGDELYPVRDKDRRVRILSTIAEDPETAMLLYGQELGHCGHCGRTLTNEESRAAGIGPICRGKVAF
jgi:hypothetical protein